MKRFHLVEIHEQEWCPRAIRDAMTDYLQFVVAKTKPYVAMVPMLAAALQRSGTVQVLDLCSGAGGPWLWLQPILAGQGVKVSVCLTDKFPNLALDPSSAATAQAIRYHPQPVDATRVPDELAGCSRPSIISARRKRAPCWLTQFDDAKALRLLKAHIAVPSGCWMFLVPLMVLLTTPFICPFRWSRLFWTYLIPVVPLVSLFDGLVSCLRTYRVQELRELTEGLDAKDYQWEFGELESTAGPIPITYLIGVPNGNPVPSPGPTSI